MPRIDWVNVAVWGGLITLALTIWALAFIGAGHLLGLLP